MFNETAFEALESESESTEWNEWNESSEWNEADERRRRRPRPIPRPNRGNAAVSAPQPGYVTKAELEATANRLDGRIAINTKAVGEVNSRVSSLGASHTRLESNVRKEVAERKAATDALKQQTENMKMAVMLTPLISSPKTTTIKDESGNDVKVLTDDGDMFRTLMPLLMLSGGFGGASGGNTSSNDMMMPLLVLAMSKK